MKDDQPDRMNAPSGPEVVLHEERLQVGTEGGAVERVLLRKVIVTEIRQVEVTVRREELHVERVTSEGRTTSGRADAGRTPLVLVLTQEVPVVQLLTQPYEKVTVHVDRVDDQQQITRSVSRERVDVSTDPPASMS